MKTPIKRDSEERAIANPRAGVIYLRDATGRTVAGVFTGGGDAAKTADSIVAAVNSHAEIENMRLAGDAMATQLELVARDLESVTKGYKGQAWTDVIHACRRQAQFGRKYFPETT